MHNKNLDGLRGWAAFIVVIYHAILHFDTESWLRLAMAPMSSFSGLNDWVTGLSLVIFNGDTAVVVFFVMSGVVLHESLMRSKENWLKTSAIFMLKRAFRVYPTVIFAVVFLVLLIEAYKILGIPAARFSMTDIVQNMTLQGNVLLGVSWTLTVEILAIVFILPVFFLTRSFGVLATMLAAAYAMLAIDNPVLVLKVDNMHQAMLAFIAGMSVALPQAQKFFARFGPLAWIPILLLLVFGSHVNAAWQTSSVILRIMAATMLVGIMRHSRSSGLDQFLTCKLSQFLGRISFSFYLLAAVVMYAVFTLTPSLPAHYAVLAGIPYGLLIAAITTPMAALTYMMIEAPAMRFSRQCAKAVSGQRAAPVTPAPDR